MANTMFSEKEVEYIKSQRIARIATAAASVSSTKEKEQGENRSLQPDVVPVGFDFDGEYLYVGGMNILKSTKYKNILKNNKVAIVIDDLKSIDPWDPRGVKIYGTADEVTRQGGYMEGTGHANPIYIRISPKKKWSWGIDEPVFLEGKFNVKRARRG
jgi:pyridoxamine 5'-phosphate oxidase family protein